MAGQQGQPKYGFGWPDGRLGGLGPPGQREARPLYLGVIVDHKLNWIDHITYVKNKISKGIGIMYKARRYLNKVSLKNLYYAYIYPYFTYCIEVWGPAAKCHLNSLSLLQKKIFRIMTFSPYLAHTAPIFIDLAILPFIKYLLIE